jgi:hypothetical protein
MFNVDVYTLFTVLGIAGGFLGLCSLIINKQLAKSNGTKAPQFKLHFKSNKA